MEGWIIWILVRQGISGIGVLCLHERGIDIRAALHIEARFKAGRRFSQYRSQADNLRVYNYSQIEPPTYARSSLGHKATGV